MQTKGLEAIEGNRCEFVKPDGTHCHARPLHGQSFCFWHDPDRVEDRREAGRTGGSRGRLRTLPEGTPDLDISDASGVVKLLSRTVNQTLRGEIDPRVANAVGYLSGVILRAREQGELEERVSRIEEALAEREGASK